MHVWIELNGPRFFSEICIYLWFFASQLFLVSGYIGFIIFCSQILRLKPDTSNSHELELHRPSNKGTKLLLKVIKAIIIIINFGT